MDSKFTRGRVRALHAAILAVLALALAAMLPAVAGATSVPHTALINGESVTFDDGIEKEGQPISLEQFAAEKAGFNVTVRSGAEWEAMSGPEFAQYQVLVVGDPDCDESAQSAVKSAPSWAPVVMTPGLEGNRTVVGTDPEDHYKYGEGGAEPTNPADPSTSGAEHLVQDGIAFAGGVEGATGVYFDTSCHDPGLGDVGVFNMLKDPKATGEWQEAETHPACASPVVQIATNPVFNTGPTKLTNADINGWECSSHVSFVSFPSDWTALAITIPLPQEVRPTPVCGSDIETGEARCGQAYVLVAGRGIVAKAPNLSLQPETGRDTIGGEHTVTANVHKDGKPLAGVPVSFVVTETNAGVTGTCTTGSGAADPECKSDENGDVRFTYKDVHGAGTDTIVGSITLEETIEEAEIEAKPALSRVVSTSERATATEEWIPAPVTPAAPAAQVLASKAAVAPKGTARMASVRGCVARSSYLASVHGSSIASVRFVLDGHTVKTLKKPTASNTFALRIKLSAGSRHHLSIRVAFTAASATSARTFTRTLARCAVRHVDPPRFTG